eukprot:PRCOL_00005829-RA
MGAAPRTRAIRRVSPAAPCRRRGGRARARVPCAASADSSTHARARAAAALNAQRAGDSAKAAKIQAAFDSIMMAGLSTRVANLGKKAPQPEVFYADRTPLFPWRPRVEVETTNNIITNTGIFGILAAWACTSAVCDYNPLVFGTVAALFRLTQKLTAFSPSPKDPEKKKIADRMRLLRVLALTFGGVALATTCVVAIPDLWAKATGGAIPIFTLRYREPLINAGSLALMWITTNFLR